MLTTSGNDFSYTDMSKFKIKIKKHTDNVWIEIANPDIIFNTVQNNSVLHIRCKTNQYEIDEWDIKAEYIGSNYVNDNTYGTFTTCTIKPTYEVVEYLEGNRANIQIQGTSYPQCIPILIKFLNNGDMEKFIGVTNQSGSVTIPYLNREDWLDLNIIQLIINPNHEDLIQSISSNSTNHLSSAINGYSRVYFGLTTDDDDTIYNQLRTQLSKYSNEYLFIIYGEDTTTQSRVYR